MVLELYWVGFGPPSRATMMTIKHLGLDVKTYVKNPLQGETSKPDYLQVYPLHKVPYLIDGNFELGESRAIMAYLADKYGKDDSFYPKDLEKRAKVNAILFYEMDAVYQIVLDTGFDKITSNKVDPEKKKKVDIALQEFEAHVLGNKKFLAGDCVTIADLAAVAGITFLEVIQYDFSERKTLKAWIDRCKALPYYKEANAVFDEAKKQYM